MLNLWVLIIKSKQPIVITVETSQLVQLVLVPIRVKNP
jgi:hypothetical protein